VSGAIGSPSALTRAYTQQNYARTFPPAPRPLRNTRYCNVHPQRCLIPDSQLRRRLLDFLRNRNRFFNNRDSHIQTKMTMLHTR